MKIFDLNVPLEDSPSEPLPVKVEHRRHEETAAFMASFFEAGVEALPINDGSNQPNGLLYCAEQCHGGNEGIAPTNKLDLSNLLEDSPNYPFMCAKVRPFIVPTNVDDSAIMTLTDPQGAAVHPFSFGGNPSAHSSFKNAMRNWIDNEGVPDE